TVWLQLGPSMRELYSDRRRGDVTASHDKIISALRAGDEPGLRVAVRSDVTSGLRMLRI
ncbi:MAG: GntR family transcriptional regulator, partial [Pseudomonadota bacterium]